MLVTGTFNIVHAGHVRLLEFASRYGKVTVGINSDSYLRNKYGEERVVPLIDRTYVLKSNVFVAKVIVFLEDDPSALILKLKPSFVVKGPDYKKKVLPEQNSIDSVGAKLIIQPVLKEYNSSCLLHLLGESAFKKFDKFS